MKKRLIILFATVLLCLPLTLAAAKVKNPLMQMISQMTTVSCLTDSGIQPVYGGLLQSIDAPGQVASGQLFAVNVKIQNTGTTPWFSDSSDCTSQSSTYLGTTRQQDRQSSFHAPLVFGDTKWLGSNRIKMKTLRVDPGQIAEFEFIAHAPEESGIYREYFAPVIENVAWIKSSAELSFDIMVGAPDLSSEIYSYTKDISSSMNLMDTKFSGQKKITADISEQKLYLKLGDQIIKTFPMSSGKPKTPTPIGNYKIQFKQDVRIGSARPHYIMPKFMQFRKGGYGIHALPSLANDRGVFWREALNHIGTPRSHGCIRLLPEDANFTYQFADVGTEMQIIW